MALALEHFYRSTLITLGTLVVIPFAKYGSLNDMSLPLNVVDDNGSANIPQADAPDTEEDTLPTIGKSLEDLNGKIKALKIDDKCLLVDLRKPQVCTLTEEELKKINLPNKDEFEEDSDLTIEGLGEGKTLTLTIEAGYLEDDFPETLRFTLRNTNQNEVKINGDNEETTHEPNIDHDYKISLISTNNTTRLSKGWSSLSHLGRKVGINMNDSLQDTCATSKHDNKINVWRSDKEYVIGADSNVGDQCPMSHEENIPGYLEGFRLKVSGNSDIILTNGKGPKNGTKIEKITKDNVSYEIGPKLVGGVKQWFLIERTS